MVKLRTYTGIVLCTGVYAHSSQELVAQVVLLFLFHLLLICYTRAQDFHLTFPSHYFFCQVLDSYLAVKLNEALYEMKEQLQVTERQVKSVIEEKERLERALREKVKLIRVRKM